MRRKDTSNSAVTSDFDFRIFFAIWAKLQGWKVPPLHIEIIDWLADNENWENGTGVLQVFRGAAKSTILGCFITYSLVKNPELRFLILSADYNTAVKITNDLTGIVSRHPLANHLRGKEKMWRENKIWVQGAIDARVPSAFSIGVTSNITGSRADFVVFDDVEVPKNVANEKLRAQLRQRISDTIHILVPGGKRLFVGTPHSYESIYPEVIDSGVASKFIPLVKNPVGEFPFITGDSSWPERFTDQEVAERQLKSLSKANFLSQYQLIPYNADDSYFDASLINVYRNEINCYSANSETVLKIGNVRMVSCSCFWDPSLAKKTSDDSVIALVFQTGDGHLYVHRTLKLTGEAEEQCRQVREFCKEYYVPQVIVETNGVGGFLPAILRKALVETEIAVVEKHSSINKATKIIEAIEVALSSGYFHVHQSVMETSFLGQIRDFSPKMMGYKGYKDDYIDSVASAIKNEPIRITSGRKGFGQQNRWQPNSGEFEMAVDSFTF